MNEQGKHKNYKAQKPSRALVLMTDRHIGNLLVSMPAMLALQDHYQSIPHCFVVDEGFAELVENVIEPANTLFYPRHKIKLGNPLSRAYAYLAFLWRLHAFKADVLVDLAGSRNSGVLSRSSGARARVASNRAKRPAMYTDLVELNADTHKVHDYTDISSALGAESDGSLFQFEPSEDKLTKIRELLKVADIQFDRPLVSVHIGAGRIQKLWSIKGFVEVVNWLTRHNCQVVFLGAKAESARVNEVISKLERPVLNMVGNISLGELLALLKLSTAYLGNDSGPMHMAAAMGTPGVAMFSYARESEWGPRSDSFILLRGQEICKPCIKKRCTDPVCINTLATEPVIRELATLLQLEYRAA